MTNPLNGPIAYLTGEYPRATDTFIQREVAALREMGFVVQTCSIRRTGPEHLVGPEQQTEAAQTFHVLEAAARPMQSLRMHLAALRRPGRYLRTLALAWRTAPAGFRAHLYQLIYFAEAVVLAQQLQVTGAVHLHNHIAKASCTVAMLASVLSGIPYSFTLHGPDDLLSPEHWRLDEKIARAAFVACISDYCRAQAMLASDRRHWDRLHVVRCGIDPARYDMPRRTPGHTSGHTPGHTPGAQLLFIGRLAAVKGLPVLFAALAMARTRRPDLHLTLIGDGPERKMLEAEARDLGLSDSMRFAGYKSQAEVAEALGEADLMVLPSFAEGVPVVLMEAMAARLPVIATRIAGVPELVTDGESGLLVAAGDATGLAGAILQMLADPAQMSRMGTAGRDKVSRDFNTMTEAAWLGILFCSVNAGGPRPGKRPTPESPTPVSLT